MTRRVVLILLVVAGCAAATPAAHHALGEFSTGHGAAHGSGRRVAGSHGHAGVHRRIQDALDGLGLAPDTRSKVEEVVREHYGRAMDLLERVRAGEIDGDAARAEHDGIVASAREALAPLLTEAQIQQLFDALHPHGDHE